MRRLRTRLPPFYYQSLLHLVLEYTLHNPLRTLHVRAPQGGFEAQSISGMQRAVFNGQMSVGDYYERQVGPIDLNRCM